MLHFCLICRTWLRREGLCQFCQEHLYRQVRPHVRDLGAYRIHSLFSWRPDESPALNAVAMGLKGRAQGNAWRPFAHWFLERRGPMATTGVGLVPVPSAHAQGFARALAETTGWPVIQALEWVGGRPQKRLSRRERWQGRRLRATISVCKDFRTVILVDDIVTTGATAGAAVAALEPSSQTTCEVFALLDRRPCGSDAPLI